MSYFLSGAIIFTLSMILAIVGAQQMDDHSRIFTFDKTIILSILTSLVASGVFFINTEIFRIMADKSFANIKQKLKLYEDEIGLRKIFLSKSQQEAIDVYKECVSNAKSRIWAVGLTNNQFLEQHSNSIRARRSLYPKIDIRILFFDPDATVQSRSRSLNDYPLITLFDFPKTIYDSQKRSSEVRHFAAQINSDNFISASIYYVLVPSYFSMMVVDDNIFFFPYLLLEDASSNPILHLSASSVLGARLINHVEGLCKNPILCVQR